MVWESLGLGMNIKEKIQDSPKFGDDHADCSTKIVREGRCCYRGEVQKCLTNLVLFRFR